ncbi:hypothetical protein [Commensalibacter nepenthis]|uniref:Uncharacterized protein n=1 Tax=Commensalibacter nepenthis TaxID=3043872 RepID=A0ABT6QA20_9PROT|nr:hypothetical protein [Commensalibacter sp. TBRC 10068]MDI2113751.1 hypothetical protein [Commensalibacter sp. TBRC 10068]
MMQKRSWLGVFLCFFILTNTALAQSNDKKAVFLLNNHLQLMFKVLNSKPDTISKTCMDSLKKLRSLKEQIGKKQNNSDTQQDINIAMLKDLYANSIEFCTTDVQNICSHRAEPAIRRECKNLSFKN